MAPHAACKVPRIDDGVVCRAFECLAPNGEPAERAAALHLLEVCRLRRAFAPLPPQAPASGMHL